jgi:HK97 family phage portal protein
MASQQGMLGKAWGRIFGKGRISNDRDYMALFSEDFMRANYDITFYQAIVYYCRLEPVASGVDTISDEFEHIRPVVLDSSDGKIEKTGHPLLKLLRFPNADVSGAEFRKQLAAYYLITGNAYVVATGEPHRPPLELSVAQPQRVTMTAASDGYAGSYCVSLGNAESLVFERKEVDGRFRYYNSDGAELWHIRSFNPRYCPSQLYGLSKLTAIYYEIEQYLKGNIHNLSLLERGARPTGALLAPEGLTEDQRRRLHAQYASLAEGAGNAGRMLLLEGKGIEFQELGKSPRDMDYLENRKAITMSIFNRLKIPLPLVSVDSMTMDNYSEARLALYDNAVLPLANMLYGELTLFLAPRYKMSEAQRLAYDDSAIPALEPRRNEQIESRRKSGVLTLNEIRRLYGYDTISGGDAVYQPSNMSPMAGKN